MVLTDVTDVVQIKFCFEQLVSPPEKKESGVSKLIEHPIEIGHLDAYCGDKSLFDKSFWSYTFFFQILQFFSPHLAIDLNFPFILQLC